MLTKNDIDKFADFIIAQEKKMLDARYPIDSYRIKNMSNEELLSELGVECDHDASITLMRAAIAADDPALIADSFPELMTDNRPEYMTGNRIENEN